MKHALPPTLLLLLATACAAPPPGEADAGTSPPSVSCEGVAPQTLDAVFAKHFAADAATSCVSAGCHGTGAGGLTFRTADELWSATVGQPSMSAPDQKLIVPGAPGASAFYARLTPSAGSRMPLGGPFLDAAAQADVAGWICAGAPRPAAVADGGTNGGTDAGTPLPPALTDFTPSSGYEGTQVTLTGQGFSTTPSNNQVRFAGTQASVLSATSTQLVTRVPTGAASGRITVSVGGQTATSAADFTVLHGNPVPVVAALSPCGAVQGAGALTLTLTGQGFLQGATVSFGGTAVPTTYVSPTELRADVVVPSTAPASRTVPVTATNPDPTGGPSTPIGFGVATRVSTLSSTVQPILTASCATAGCHNGSPNTPGNFSSGLAWDELVGMTSTGCPSKLRVQACAPTREESFLVDKILATASSPACFGAPMPHGAPLDAAEKQAILDWVAQGAPQ